MSGSSLNTASICQDLRSSQAWWTQNYTLRFKQLDNLLSAHWLSLQVTASIICYLCEWPAFLKVEVTVFIEVTIIPFVAKLIFLWNLQENCYRHLLNSFLSAELAVFSRIARISFFCAWYMQKLTLKRLLRHRYHSTDPISPLVFLKQLFKHWNSRCASVLFLVNLVHVQGQLTTARPPRYRNHNLKSWFICYVTKLHFEKKGIGARSVLFYRYPDSLAFTKEEIQLFVGSVILHVSSIFVKSEM